MLFLNLLLEDSHRLVLELGLSALDPFRDSHGFFVEINKQPLFPSLGRFYLLKSRRSQHSFEHGIFFLLGSAADAGVDKGNHIESHAVIIDTVHLVDREFVLAGHGGEEWVLNIPQADVGDCSRLKLFVVGHVANHTKSRKVCEVFCEIVSINLVIGSTELPNNTCACESFVRVAAKLRVDDCCIRIWVCFVVV